jgi:hypothetical protein
MSLSRSAKQLVFIRAMLAIEAQTLNAVCSIYVGKPSTTQEGCSDSTVFSDASFKNDGISISRGRRLPAIGTLVASN